MSAVSVPRFQHQVSPFVDFTCEVGWNDRGGAVLQNNCRPWEEIAGTKIFAARGGHIPGAINLDWLELMDRNNQLRLRTDIRNLIEDRGIRSANSVITHCQTHHRSGLTYLVGKLLGLNIKAYHGSWSEWGNDPDTPIENPALSTKNS